MAACFPLASLSHAKTTIFSRVSLIYKPICSSFPKTLNLSVNCSSPSSKTLDPFISFVKPAVITITTAALIFSQYPKPSLSNPNPPQTLNEEEYEENSIVELQSLLDSSIKSGNLSEAFSVLDRMMELQPDNTEYPLLKSHLLIQSGEIDLAKQSFEEIIAENPFSVEAYNGLVMASREGGESLSWVLERVKKCIEMCRKEKRKEDERYFRMLKAEILVCEGKYEEGIRVYEELKKEDPRDFRVYLCEGIAYLLMKKMEEAEKMFEKYKRLVPNGHKYRRYFDDNVLAMKVLREMENTKEARMKI